MAFTYFLHHILFSELKMTAVNGIVNDVGGFFHVHEFLFIQNMNTHVLFMKGVCTQIQMT